MGSGPRIAIDAMGGDVGPAVMIAGAALGTVVGFIPGIAIAFRLMRLVRYAAG